MTDEEFIDIIKISYNIRQALIKMNLKPKGGNYKVLVNRCKKLSISLPVNETLVMKAETQKQIRKSIKSEEIIRLCSELYSRRHVLCRLGLYPEYNSNVIWIKNKILELNINSSHWTGMAHLKGKKIYGALKPTLMT